MPTEWIVESLTSTTVITLLIGIVTGIVTALAAAFFHDRFQRRARPERIAIAKNSVEFLGSTNNTSARNLFRNDGLALIVHMLVRSEGRAVLLSRCKLTLRTEVRKEVLVGTLNKDETPIEIYREKYTKVGFIFNPSACCRNLAELSQFVTGAVYSLELLNIDGRTVGKGGDAKIKEFRFLKLNRTSL
jgi:hypothetical protein